MCNKSDIQWTVTPQVGGNGAVVTVFDQASKSIVGRRTIRCTAIGDLSKLTEADAIKLVGGFYRLACLRCDHACRRLKMATERVSRSIRDYERRVRKAQSRRDAE